MKVTQYHLQSDLSLDEAKIDLLVRTLMKYRGLLFGEVIFYFVDEKRICELHEEFFSDPSPTDCMTFPIDGPNVNSDEQIIGEVFICPKAAIDYAPHDPLRELSLYISHTILHLLGYEDHDEASRNIMREKEKECMDYLDEKNCILSNPQSPI